MLSIDRLRTGYGAREAVFDVSLSVGEGEVVTLVGHNGAGKTTTLKAAMGLLPVWGGTVSFLGRPITNSSSAANVRRGLCMVLEDDFVFRDLTVEENLQVAAFTTPADAAAGIRRDVFALLPVLAERRTQRAGTMSGGERRMLSLGMALMSQARLLLLDEPSLGLAPVLVEQVMGLVGRLVVERGLSVLMVEQNVDQALRIADRVYVLRAGRIAAEEDAAALRRRSQWWDLF
ncbi:ABC transporter ATP-binding protein [Pseudonocardia kunmingensis]|uniref:Amino acid/amide ABC transporter ATP-binding protein 2 (HAAT family) n=1 Tax=Pseudonocardia kunmingensis TaxID=630975 RepID=A0A543DL75_9PSEU|nr:ABC transporter ATP-binding protein [Pseudonocardia kunmingensis]TQM10097.1 amino acid/amide ABC transporter ATP-binding protein 2 (HAAT family) [Pseudonocardia kunmingensis]